jgi:hypothetical protein
LLHYYGLNPNFSVEKFALGDEDPDPYGRDVMLNPDLQIVMQFVASAAWLILHANCKIRVKNGMDLKNQLPYHPLR